MMSSADKSRSSSGSSDSVGNYKRNIDQDNEEEKEEIKEQIQGEVNEEVEQPRSGVLLSYIYPNSTIEESEIEKIRKNDLKKLLEDKKLILVLHLEYTLIDSVLLDNLIDTDTQLLDLDTLFQHDEHCMLIKLRPYIRDFLKEANNMFEMYLSATKQQDSFDEVVAILDPDDVYFPSRAICRPDDTTWIKNGLDAKLGVENVVIILDDIEKVWEDHMENLIVLEEYNFFAYTVKELGPDFKSLSKLGKDESTSRETLKNILDVLKRVHECFYDPKIKFDLASRDVRVILDSLRKSILGGCNIVFSGIFSSYVRHEEHPIWKFAEGMGAICSTDVNDLTTHVVEVDPDSKNAAWARENNKFLVTIHWILVARYLWKRQKEENFLVGHKH